MRDYTVVACLTESTAAGMLKDRDAAMKTGAWGVEYRIDYLIPDQRRRLLSDSSVFNYPAIVTARLPKDGGTWDSSEQERLEILQLAMDHGAPYLDVEIEAFDAAGFLSKRDPEKTSLIVSHHNINRMPEDLEKRYDQLKATGADVVKLATHAHTFYNCLKMLQLVARAEREEQPIIGLCMGDAGKITRVLGPVYGGWTMARFGEAAASGQLSLEETIRLVKEAQRLYDNGVFRDPDEITFSDLQSYARILKLA